MPLRRRCTQSRAGEPLIHWLDPLGKAVRPSRLMAHFRIPNGRPVRTRCRKARFCWRASSRAVAAPSIAPAPGSPAGASHHAARVASSTSASNAESASAFACRPTRWSRHDDDENGASDAPVANVVASSVPASASKSPLSAPFSISAHAASSARVAATYAPRASSSAFCAFRSAAPTSSDSASSAARVPYGSRSSRDGSGSAQARLFAFAISSRSRARRSATRRSTSSRRASSASTIRLYPSHCSPLQNSTSGAAAAASAESPATYRLCISTRAWFIPAYVLYLYSSRGRRSGR